MLTKRHIETNFLEFYAFIMQLPGLIRGRWHGMVWQILFVDSFRPTITLTYIDRVPLFTQLNLIAAYQLIFKSTFISLVYLSPPLGTAYKLYHVAIYSKLIFKFLLFICFPRYRQLYQYYMFSYSKKYIYSDWKSKLQHPLGYAPT